MARSSDVTASADLENRILTDRKREMRQRTRYQVTGGLLGDGRSHKQGWEFRGILRLKTVWPLVGLMAAALTSAAQPTTATWRGYLRNSAGAPMAGAKVCLTGAATAEASTADDGAFALPALPPGQYKLIVAAAGRNAAYARAIDLTPGSPVEVVTLSSRG